MALGYPNDNTHLSNFARADMLDQYGGEVESQFAKSSIMRQFVRIRPLRGSDTLINRRAGKTQLQKVGDTEAGQFVKGIATGFGKVSVDVDTIILARDNRALLNDLQTDFDARMELAQDHGKEIGKFFDESFLIQCIHGAQAAAPSGLNGAIGAGKSVTLGAAGDELDPTKFEKAIRDTIVKMAEEDIDRNELIVWVRPTQFDILLKNDKLMNVQYSSGNGDYASNRVALVAGARIVESARIPNAVNASHKLGTAYNVSATDAKAKAVIMHPKSLLAAETIPLTSDIWYDKASFQWFIDSYLSYGVAVNRPDVCGCVFAF